MQNTNNKINEQMNKQYLGGKKNKKTKTKLDKMKSN
jgi:hypothetical protein